MITPTRTLPFLLLLCSAAAIAQTQPNTWDAKRGPAAMQGVGGAIVGAVDPDTGHTMLYGVSETQYVAIQQYDVDTSTWTTRAQMPNAFTSRLTATWAPATRQVFVISTASGTTRVAAFDPAEGLWEQGGNFPAAGPGLAVAADSTRLYALAGNVNGGKHFYTGEIAAPVFSELAATPDIVGAGAALVWDGGNYLYAQQGGIAAGFWRFDTRAGGAWVALRNIPEAVRNGGALAMDAANGKIYCSTGSDSVRSVGFYCYSVAAGTWTALANRPGTANSLVSTDATQVGGMCYPGAGDNIYFLRGQMTNDFWIYSISNNRFSTTANAPGIGGAGASVTGAAGRLYFLQGGGLTGFHSYSPSTNAWTTLAPYPATVGNGGGLAWDHGDSIYATRGASTADFYRYSIAANTWSAAGAVSPLPIGVSDGGCLQADGGDFVYAFSGTTDYNRPIAKFYRYSVSANSWLELAAAPSGVGSGAAIVYPGGDFLYAWPARATKEFWVYRISTNAWNDGFDPADPPIPAGAGAALCWPGGGDKIYAFMGWDGSLPSTRFKVYTMPDEAHPTGQWTTKLGAPGMTFYGAGLAYPGRGQYLYGMPGDNTSTLWRYWMELQAPDAPVAGQFRPDGVTPIDVGGAIVPTEVVIRSTVSDPDRDWLVYQVEMKEVGTDFSGASAGIVSSAPVTSGSTVSLLITGLTTGHSYHWRSRVVELRELESPWANFGQPNPETEPDLVIRTNTAPLAQTARQTSLNNEVLAVGAAVNIDDRSVILQASVQDGDPYPDRGRIHVEVRPVGEPFSGDATASSDMVENGGTASIRVEVGEGGHHWQVCAEDEWGSRSAWTPFGGNSEAQADFALNQFGSFATGRCSANPAAGTGAFLLAVVVVLAGRRVSR